MHFMALLLVHSVAWCCNSDTGNMWPTLFLWCLQINYCDDNVQTPPFVIFLFICFSKNTCPSLHRLCQGRFHHSLLHSVAASSLHCSANIRSMNPHKDCLEQHRRAKKTLTYASLCHSNVFLCHKLQPTYSLSLELERPEENVGWTNSVFVVRFSFAQHCTWLIQRALETCRQPLLQPPNKDSYCLRFLSTYMGDAQVLFLICGSQIPTGHCGNTEARKILAMR